MKILMVGSGNVASVLGRQCKQKGHEIVAIASRNPKSGMTLSAELNTRFISVQDAGNMDADIFIIAVSDSAVKEVASSLRVPGKLVVHTAGAVSMEVLQNSSQNYGVLYPLQSLRREMISIPSVPLLIDGNNDHSLGLLANLAHSLSENVERANDEQRAKLHVAAVFVSNFSNHLYLLAEGYCKAEHLDFKLLYPLIVETASRLKDTSPSELQTGPAFRKDISTLEKHLRLLSNYPKLKLTYTRLTDSIMNS